KPRLVSDLDALPYPDFDEYFANFEFPDSDHAATLGITMESSRGCWWGEKHHCVFCGLNGQAMKYRSKSAQRTADEMRYLVETYGVDKIMMSDNIMSNRFFRELLPILTESRAHRDVFFELKANLKKRELAALAAAGIRHLQPGIESLSTKVLGLMDKGSDAFTNLQMLKWSKELGIYVSWNLLAGFPGERPEDYEEMAELILKVPHLQPAIGFVQISVDRFSPFFMYPERYGIQIRPFAAYRYVYPLPDDEIRNLAYFFTHTSSQSDTSESYAVPDYARRSYQAYLMWMRLHARVEFSYEITAAGRVSVRDTRPCSQQQDDRLLDPLESQVFLALDEMQSMPS